MFYFYSRCSLSTIVYDKFYDWEQHFAEEGFLVLTSRYRSSNGSEETIVKEVLKEVFKRQVDLDTILNGKLMTQEMAFIQSNQVSISACFCFLALHNLSSTLPLKCNTTKKFENLVVHMRALRTFKSLLH